MPTSSNKWFLVLVGVCLCYGDAYDPLCLVCLSVYPHTLYVCTSLLRFDCVSALALEPSLSLLNIFLKSKTTVEPASLTGTNPMWQSNVIHKGLGWLLVFISTKRCKPHDGTRGIRSFCVKKTCSQMNPLCDFCVARICFILHSVVDTADLSITTQWEQCSLVYRARKWSFLHWRLMGKTQRLN